MTFCYVTLSCHLVLSPCLVTLAFCRFCGCTLWGHFHFIYHFVLGALSFSTLWGHFHLALTLSWRFVLSACLDAISWQFFLSWHLVLWLHLFSALCLGALSCHSVLTLCRLAILLSFFHLVLTLCLVPTLSFSLGLVALSRRGRSGQQADGGRWQNDMYDNNAQQVPSNHNIATAVVVVVVSSSTGSSITVVVFNCSPRKGNDRQV